MDERERFLELLAKKKLNNSTLSDIAELNLLCKKLQINLHDFDSTDDFSGLKFSPKYLPTTKQTQRSWIKFKNKVKQPTLKSQPVVPIQSIFNRKSKLVYTAIAAMLIISLSIGLLLFDRYDASNSKLNMVSTQYGSKSKIQLPDGTEVWLNGGSKITYRNDYGANTRTINLIGEAYFDVKHDARHPFIIHTKNLKIKVLGTAFNVRAYEEEAISEATLIRGSLEVSFPNRPNEKILLKSKEKVSFIATEQVQSGIPKNEEIIPNKTMISLSKVEYSPKEKLFEEIAWRENKLIFRSKAFIELALDLERWYNVKIEIENNKIKDKKFTGIFKNETVLEALDALKQTYSFEYSVDKKNNKIVIN